MLRRWIIIGFAVLWLVKMLRRDMRNCLLDLLMCLYFKYFFIIFSNDNSKWYC